MDEGDFKIESYCAPGQICAPDDRALAFCDSPVLHHNPVAAETCGPDPADGVIYPNAEGIEWKAKMANVPTDWTPDQEKQALARVKELDPNGEQDLIFTGIRKGGYALFFVRARNKQIDPKTKLRRVVDQRLMFLPAAATGTLDDFVAYFAQKYGDGDQKAGETVFRKKALDAELVSIRSRMKAKPGTGKRRGKTLV